MPLDLSDTAPTFELEPIEGGERVRCYEMARQPYTNAFFAAGLVEGAEPDTVYLRHDRDGEEPLIVLLRPDEMQAIAWVCNGALWSHETLEEESLWTQFRSFINCALKGVVSVRLADIPMFLTAVRKSVMPKPKMDPACIDLCKAMNLLPGIWTTSSCCGHGESPYRIWFRASSLDALSPLVFWFANCHCGFPGWSVIVECWDARKPPAFRVEGPVDAYEQAEEIAKMIAANWG